MKIFHNLLFEFLKLINKNLYMIYYKKKQILILINEIKYIKNFILLFELIFKKYLLYI